MRRIYLFKIALISLVLGVTGNIARGQTATFSLNPDVDKYLNELVRVVKDNSAFSGKLDWTAVTAELHRRANSITSKDALYPLANYVIDELRKAGDRHSFLMNRQTTQQYGDGSLVKLKAESQLIDGKFGYIQIPALSTTDPQTARKFANDIQQMIRQLDSQQQVKGWIVDLSQNTGGNMYPMIAGLGPLTGDGVLGYFVRQVGPKRYYVPWFYRSGTSGMGKGVTVRVDSPYRLKEKSPRIAVIIGKLTSSSGEMTAISFLAHQNVKFFGQPTGGFTTANGPFVLPDGATLLLATMSTADRNKKQIDGALQPDVVVEPGKHRDLEIQAAKSWLSGESK